MNYYIADTTTGTHQGPFSIEQLRSMNIAPSTLVWNESMKDWTRAADVPELSSALFPMTDRFSDTSGYAYADHSKVAPECPHTWLVESILATIFCCLPLGIAGIVNAAKVSGEYRSGRYEEAQKSSRLAKIFVIWSVVISVVVTIVYLIIISLNLLPIAGMENLNL